jgi:hypothetical protein
MGSQDEFSVNTAVFFGWCNPNLFKSLVTRAIALILRQETFARSSQGLGGGRKFFSIHDIKLLCPKFIDPRPLVRPHPVANLR